MSGAPKSVLVVEDNALNMKLFADLLEAGGHRVIKGGDGNQALALAREHRPDLILMDIKLPGISGLEVTRQLKADDALRAIPVVAVTAFASKSDEDKIKAAGCEGYLSKPIAVKEFLATVARFLGPGGAT